MCRIYTPGNQEVRLQNQSSQALWLAKEEKYKQPTHVGYIYYLENIYGPRKIVAIF